MKEKNSLIAFSGANTSAGFRLDLTQKDLIELAVSDREDELTKQETDLTVKIKEKTVELEKQEKKIGEKTLAVLIAVNSKIVSTAKELASLVGGKVIVSVRSSRNCDEEGNPKDIIGSVVGDNKAEIRLDISAKSDAELKKLISDKEAMKKEREELRTEQYKIHCALGDVDRLLRKARANVTRTALEDAPELLKLVPKLGAKEE